MPSINTDTKITISNNISINSSNIIIEEIFTLIKNEGNLSFRKKSELKKLIKEKNITCLFADDVLAGFLMSHKLSSNLIEIHGLFTKKEFRGNNFSSMLISNVTKNNKYTYFAATFLKNIVVILGEHGFNKTEFRQLTFQEKLRFIEKRCKFHRIKEVLRHKKNADLIFMKK
jgi:hypothetical protein